LAFVSHGGAVNTEKILVVEDSAAIALDLSWQLETLGYEVVGTAASGEEALQQIADTEPDAVLMDIRLSGGMDGIETAARIPDTVNPAVIYLTGSSEEATLKRARETQPYGYLLKPFSERELHATIQIALERRRAAEMLMTTERRLEAANAALQAEVRARIQSEQEIRRERDTAQSYLDVAGVMILSLNADGVVTLINNRGCAILGHDGPRDILGKSWLDCFVAEEKREAERSRFDAFKQRSETSLDFEEYPVVTKDGDRRIIAWRTKLITDADGVFSGTLSSGDDITEQHRARAEREALVVDLRQTQERLVDAQRISQMGHWEYDRARREIWLSARVAELFGLKAADMRLTEDALLQFVHPEDRDLLREAVELCKEAGTLNFEHRILCPDGAVRWMHERADITSQDSPHKLIGTAQDITDRKGAEARMHEMQDELLHVSRLSAMGQMTSTLAHEVNQPLAAIGNYIRAGLTMLDSDDPEIVTKGRGAFEKAALQAERASDVVSNLRAFVRKGDAVRKPENLSLVIQDAITLAQLGSQRSTIIQTNLSDAAEWATVNRIQIQQVLVNLIRNAIEAMNGGRGEITVQTRLTAPDTIEVSVADNGPGLPAKLNGDVFKPFVSTKPQGMGVGLAICQSIVEAHGGRIWVESPPNDGAVFHFTVPGPNEATF
jgi:two-component system sensor kinase FixL